MEQPKTSNRKKFLLWGAAILSTLTVLKFIPGNKQEKKPTRKMLTQDGKLVEVDADKLYCGKRKKITDEQLKTWVNKN
ncbi:MAG TPA: hypothetical protein VIZ28_07565 [Chitinophagaceae bacterium]